MKGKTNDRTLLGVAALAVGIMIVLGWSFAPSSVASNVSAANQEGQGGATVEMLAYALNFKSAQSLGVFGGNSVSDQGSEIRGVVGSTGEIAGVASNALSVGDAAEARRDLLDAFSAVDQLPCENINDSNLGGRSFGPGVYCLASASLAGRMMVDAGGDANARFVFRVNGTFTAEDASSIVREGGAAATNVYIFSRNAASIGADAAIGGNVISREDVTVGHGSTVSGKVIGVNGDVSTDSNIVAAGTAYVEICKELAEFDRIPVGTIFTFTVSGVAGTIQVPAGAFQSPNCSPPILVASGTVSVTEAVRANTAVIGIQATPSNRLLGSSSLAAQRADLIVPEGDVTNQTVVTFRNQTTRTGTIEICKFAAPAITGRTSPDLPADPDVTGFFNFTVQGAPGQTFAVPVGFCSGPITVTILQANAGPSPSPTQAFATTVTELAKPTFRCESVTTFPANALNPGSPIFDVGLDANGIPIANINGCVASVALNVAGGAANQTTVRFFNRSLPGRIKVCKITADPVNIPVGTTFSFGIAGLAGPMPGTLVNFETLDVIAGPAAQGGFCAFSANTWVVGSNVLIFEIGISPNNQVTLPLDNAKFPAPITQNSLGTSRIQASTPFVTPPFTVPGVGGTFLVNPNLGGIRFGPNPYGVISARNTTAEIEFTNFVYRPAILKLCKNAGAGVAVGTPFLFSIAPADPLTTWPYPTTPITVPAGSCTFVNGPFPDNVQFPGVGLFNFGTSIVVTEAPAAGTTISAITSPTLTALGGAPNFNGTLTPDLANRRATMTLNQILGIPVLPATPTTFYFNELSFTNIAAIVPPPVREARYDFDGDHASDVALFRPSDGNWYYNASGTGQARAIHFGQAGDIPVAADYDGDGSTDVAVYRGGLWYVLGSTSGFSATSFGVASDIPQTGDFDGDGKADFAVYRQSTGVWYIMGSASGFRADQFGISTDIPVASDFDGDGKTDPAVYRNGTWYILGSTAGFSGVQFGTTGDKPVQADYDGDGRSDVAVYRGGTWYIMGSSNGFRAAQFGTSTDTPVPADYDGDGKTDIAVYRSSETNWYILNSSQAGNAVGGFSAKQFGSAGDVLMGY